ncbi:hypothetical protein CKO28_19370 [Rhodovibrio sodomensis]|uniref:STAS domain-containing protein n=1 Tax=Rhodovibrio sodomensis TaxID=1088 RepID=A0ABS1DIS5_9PROT|nr:hypothetical protein [Rhodovibrio sodomensis]
MRLGRVVRVVEVAQPVGVHRVVIGQAYVKGKAAALLLQAFLQARDKGLRRFQPAIEFVGFDPELLGRLQTRGVSEFLNVVESRPFSTQLSRSAFHRFLFLGR